MSDAFKTDDPGENINRKKYVPSACHTCRKDHRKCTGKPKCKRCIYKGVLCTFGMFKKKRGPKSKSNNNDKPGDPNIVDNDPINQVIQMLIQELNSTKNFMVDDDLYYLKSPPQIISNMYVGNVLPLYPLNTVYNMPTGCREIDYLSLQYKLSIKEVVDNSLDKIITKFNPNTVHNDQQLIKMLIQELNSTKESLTIALKNLMVDDGLYSLESPPQIISNMYDGDVLPLYPLNTVYNMPTGCREIDDLSLQYKLYIKEVVDNSLDKIIIKFTYLLRVE
ncbi:1842_t:CDS:1 [Scutellospora calospora]|uniref:1842_t:CDS:1 n=1 Tax=Scutellospora calospora TaxID=85575 RepID=A0ACA9JWD0_9GLOM|nr:1842_t:CDS:1 [Scutellospora calospora]